MGQECISTISPYLMGNCVRSESERSKRCISTICWYLMTNHFRLEFERPKLFEVKDWEDFPIIDFDCDDLSSIQQQLYDAVQKYGFFRVLNLDGFVNRVGHLLAERQVGDPAFDFSAVPAFDFSAPAFDFSDNFSAFLSECEVHERYNQELYCLFNMLHYYEIDAKKLDAALKSLKEKYYDGRMDCRKCIRRGDVAGTSPSRPSSLEGGGVSVSIGLANSNGDPTSSVKHLPPGKGKVPHDKEGAGEFANVSGDATGNMNADLEVGRVNNGDPGNVASSVVPHVGHTADRSAKYGVDVAMTVFRVSAGASCTTTSNFAKASYAIGLAESGAAIVLGDTRWQAITPILAKASIVACGVGLLADLGKDLPVPLFMGAMTAAITIIIAVMVFAKRLP